MCVISRLGAEFNLSTWGSAIEARDFGTAYRN